jgi:fibro-slime domain-containing protein
MLSGDVTTITATALDNENGNTGSQTQSVEFTTDETTAAEATDKDTDEDVRKNSTAADASENTEAALAADATDTDAATAADAENLISIQSEPAADGVVVTMEGTTDSFPAGTEYELQVTAVADEEAVTQAVENSDIEIEEYVAYDIDLYVDGKLSEPTGNVNVTFSGNLPVTAGQEDNIAVYHVDGNDLVEVAETTADAEEQTVEMVTDHFSVYLIGLKGTAKNIFSIVQNNEYLQIVSTNDPDKNDSDKKDSDTYDYSPSEMQQDDYYLQIQVYYTNSEGTKERVAMSPDNFNESVFLKYTAAEQSFELKLDSKYKLQSTELKYIYNCWEDSQNETSGDVKIQDNVCSVKLNPRGQSGSTYINYLYIYLEDADAVTETKDFNVNFFKYDKDTVNKVSKNLDSSNYLEFNSGSGSAEWNQNHDDGVYQGLAAAELDENGLIQFNKKVAKIFSKTTETEYKTVTDNGNGVTSYYNVTFPFQKIGDYYVYDSNAQSAAFNTENGTVSIDDSNGGFWPFGQYAYHFGMNFETEFYMTEDGKYNGSDSVFEFSGDDDVWVYVDGVLVLDLGGIHPAVGGSINFATGEVELYMAGTNAGSKGAISTKADYISDVVANQNDVIQYASYNFYDYDNGLNKEDILNGAAHSLQVYYLERGGGASNCKMKFNLPQTPQQTVPESTAELAYSKTTTLDNWDDRTYQIDIEASSLVTETVTQTTAGVADVMLVMDCSASMKDSKTVSLGAFNGVVDGLDTSKPYTLYKNNKDNTLQYNASKGKWQYYKQNNRGGGTWQDVESTETGTVKLTQTKLAFTQDAATDFTDSATESSKVGLVSFTTSATTDYALSTLSDTQTLDREINSLTTVTSGGTSISSGLSAAKEQLDAADDSNPKYIILFTDGVPAKQNNQSGGSGNQPGGGPGNQQVDKSWSDSEAKAAKEIAAAIKEAGYTIYTVSLITENANSTNNAKSLLSSIASEGCAYTIDDMSELSGIFAEISEDVTKNAVITGATVTDVIDSRFALADGEAERLITGYGDDVITIANGDGTTTVQWTNQTIQPKNSDGTSGNHYTINIVAKADFIGGNNIPTNADGSTIEALGEKHALPQPLVNVKAELTVKNHEEEIFLGENTPVGDAEVLQQMFDAYGNDAYTFTWYEDKELTEEISVEDIGETVPTVDGKEYYLKVTFDAGAPTEESLNNTKDNFAGIENADGSYVVTAVNAEDTEESVKREYGVYTIKVIAGTITITKSIAASDYKNYQGNPIFTFQIENETTGKTFYKTVRFTAEDCKDKDDVTHTVQITGLEKGTYVVSELNTLRYAVDKVSVDIDSTTCAYKEAKDTVTFAIGYPDQTGYVSAADKANLQYGKVDYRNKKVGNNNKLTDTDVVKNSLVIGEKISTVSTADNEATGAN